MRTFRPEKINKIIFKISGEVLAGGKGFGFDLQRLNEIADDIIRIKNLGYRIGIVIGGGNVFRGESTVGNKMNRVKADSVGMLATVQNAIILSEVIRERNYQTEVYSAVQMPKIAKFYTPSRAITSLNEGKICFFCAGTGNPFFTTDTAAVLRAIEVKADVVFKGTKVDGIYSDDPAKNPNATFIKDVTFDEVLDKKLKVMDMTAFSLARDNNISIKIFNISKPGNLVDVVTKKDVGSFVN
ncbi:MAG: UMP kinase [Candidatus Cloacimonetes bacterium]|jgi:uridylate kinase|nr:UMP kinase [Candidatus Cloacimonadota bacterium]MBT6993513.1 UMP kinase [Candidatus Cloacimonadota bacterium]MBT7470138.1 UMP kinase [Candidatus Cloacimonadota bacterium]